MEKDIILIGNGPSACRGEFGKDIDRYNRVVRFSWFHIKGYEEHVGTKTDIWFTTVADGSRMKDYEYQIVYEHSWQWDPKKDKTFNLLKAVFPKVKKVKRETILEMQEFVGTKEYFTYSTGAIATFLFLQDYEYVTLHGFDWATPNPGKTHHYGDFQKRGGIHKVDQEYIFFEKLLQEGRIKRL